MATLIQFIARVAPIIYALAVLGLLLSIRGIIIARQSMRVAVFGLEREAARDLLRRSFNSIAALAAICAVVYILANIVSPNLGTPQPDVTPTPIVFVTQQPTATTALLLYPTITPTVGVPPAAGTTAATADATINGCEILGATITSPVAGQTVTGQVAVEGQANILNFAQYKFEVRGAQTGGAWVVVGTYPTPMPEGFLGAWDSTSLLPGDYTLRLVVLRVDGSYPVPCEVPIIVAGSSGAPSQP